MQTHGEKRLQAMMCLVFGILLIAFTINYHKIQCDMDTFSRRRRVLSSTMQRNFLEMGRQYQAYPRHHPYFSEYTRPRVRRMWAKKRSTDWWERIVLKEFTSIEWMENFRMTQQTFRELCDTLRCKLAPSPNFVRTPISVEMKVAVALYKLGSCCEYRIVANQFGIHKSSVHNIMYSFCNAITEVLGQHISMPNAVECQELSHLFELKCGIPQVIGAIDGTHIPILAPSDGFRDFVNRKGWPSYNVQAVVDVHYRFRDITCKHPGSSHDAAVLRDSYLFQKANQVVPQGEKIIDGRKIPFMILGDPAYPLLPWLMKGFRTRGNDVAVEESFNAYLSKGRIVVENAFGRLKGRWRCLLKRNDISFKFMPKVIVACCILHNLVETRKETFINQWMDNVRDAELQYPQPHAEPSREDGLVGSEIRNALKEYMARNFPLLQSKFR